MARVVVYHRYYGCDTGCCGHVVELDGKEVGRFAFGHAESKEEARSYAEVLIREQLGEEHVKDLDFENSVIFDHDCPL